jgi:putative membrane protein
MSRFSVPLRVAAVSATTLAVGMMAISPAVAAGSDAQVVNTETVQVYTDATGAIQTQRIYEQLALTGEGSAEVRNPIETKGLRNLDGFRGYSVEEGYQVAELASDGKNRLRTVSDYTGDLPLDVQVRYTLDGEPVEPGDVVGKSGRLEVRYTVKNVTGAPQEVTFDDGQGGTMTRTVEVPIPMVGSLTTVAPPNFTDVASGEANMAGDGKGGTKLSFTMTLFPPIGSDTAEFGYTANITDGVVPRASISALPVNPLESPSFKAAGESYKGGADTGSELAAGATEIDANLLKLRDGAGDLLAGLIQLRDGAVQLEAGLAGEAAPGADRLAGGASELAGGIGQIDDGAGQLAAGASELNSGAARLGAGAWKLDEGAGQLANGSRELAAGTKKLAGGTGQLSAGTGAALTGSQKLSEGLGLISGGLSQLADAEKGLPAAQSGIAELKAGVDLLISKLGTVDNPETLIGGLAKLEAGLGELQTGAGQLAGGLNLLRGDGSDANPGLVRIKGGVDQVQAGLAAAVGADGSLDDMIGGLTLMKQYFCANYDMVLEGDPYPHPEGALTCTAVASDLLDGATLSKSKLTEANAGLLAVSGGLADAIGSLDTLFIPGAGKVSAGAGDAKAGATALKSGAIEFKGGMQQVSGGMTQLSEGIAAAVGGVLQLSSGSEDAFAGSKDLTGGLSQLDAGAKELNSGAKELDTGAGRLAAGAGELSAGTGQLAEGSGALVDGAGRLSAGAGELADGTGKAADGANQVADGASQLATGLGDAADGSGKLADGLDQAAKGAPKIRDGAQRLSDEGTSKLVEAGEATAQNYGEMYATIAAGAERAQTEKMVYGAPENAIGLAAYSYEIKGEDGAAGRNLTKGLGAMALLGAGAGAFALRRRII